MIRPRYLPDSIVAQLVSVSAFLHSLDPKRTWRAMSGVLSSHQKPANSAPTFPKLDVPRCHDGIGLPSLLTLSHSAPNGDMAELGEPRRLTAIFAADMVGYSRLMEADERETIARQTPG